MRLTAVSAWLVCLSLVGTVMVTMPAKARTSGVTARKVERKLVKSPLARDLAHGIKREEFKDPRPMLRIEIASADCRPSTGRHRRFRCVLEYHFVDPPADEVGIGSVYGVRVKVVRGSYIVRMHGHTYTD